MPAPKEGAPERFTAAQRSAMAEWAAWLYAKGYTTQQTAVAMGIKSSSTISQALARQGVRTRVSTGVLADPEPGIYAEFWRKCLPVPGEAAKASALNRHGLLTIALDTWKSKNALSVLANRAEDATEAELDDAVLVLAATVSYANQLIRALTDPQFAKTVRTSPAYRDDVGHRFR